MQHPLGDQLCQESQTTEFDFTLRLCDMCEMLSRQHKEAYQLMVQQHTEDTRRIRLEFRGAES